MPIFIMKKPTKELALSYDIVRNAICVSPTEIQWNLYKTDINGAWKSVCMEIFPLKMNI